ncbi:SpoIIE family protein phosphatase [Micromonospora soli]|uniref:SpoIIE family protein phosphatase n=1 Tax=Micromonospora sp. NBRC 110009 TaxID=3061627 RepID=UPI002672E3A9|nr:SpoIIE family protein phosphatase [Micromonospora sp. NBRC 110009]WKT96590.1 SpoIIE family protein phosphatase [Micromonospora sp. NBRC 110009]
MNHSPSDSSSRWQDLFATGGEMGAAIAGRDWTATPLGPIDSWPQSLRTAVSICLHSRFPILLWWGDELVMLYNDAYVPMLGASKRGALGRPGAAVWPEIWEVIGPMLGDVMAGRGATWSEDQLLLLDRFGFVEECWFTFSYSPILDESGTPGGVFTAVTETTDRVLGERRLRLLSTLGAALVDVTDPEEVGRRTVKALAGSASTPFARLYLAGADGPRLVAADDAGAPPGAAESWPLAEVLADGELRLLPVDPADAPDRPGAPKLAVVPVSEPGGSTPTAVLVIGLNPRRPADADYLSFLRLLSGHVGAALAAARTYQAEHRRAEALADQGRVDALDLSTERAARAELRLFQALVERSGDFIAVADPDGRAVYVNPAGRALVGLTEGERVDGLTLVDFAAPHARELWRTELIPAALRTGHHHAESRLVRRDTGEPVDVDHQTFTVTTGDGQDTTAFVATVARDVTDRQRTLRQAEALARLAGALSSAQGRAAIVDVVTTVAPAVVEATGLRVAIARPGATLLDVAGGDAPPRQLPVDADDPLARAVRDNVVLEPAPAGDRTTGVCLPLRYGDGAALGALEVRWTGPVADDEALRNLLHAVAGLCSQALQRAELTGSAQAMADFAARLSVARSTTEAIDVILTAAPVALGAVLPGLAMRDEGQKVRLWYHDVPATLSATFHDLTVNDPRPIVRALRTGERVILRDRAQFAARFPGLPDPVGAHGVVTTVALPLFDAQRQPFASLAFGWFRERPLRDSDLALLDTIADLCEQTLERVRLAAAEHNLVTRLAGRLRSSALTTPDGLEIATRYQPAMTGLHLGGDWYDLVRQDDDRLAVVVGDVVGHRVEAAADMAQLRTMLNTLIRLGVPLEEVFLRLTELLGVGFLGTCLVVVVDPAAGRAQVARAGHPHPVLLPAGGDPESVPTVNALPLGMVDAPMTLTTVPFRPGDLLVAYTDGLVERRGQAYDEGVAALHRALVAVRDEPAEAIADALLRDLPGGEDDRALVVLRHAG